MGNKKSKKIAKEMTRKRKKVCRNDGMFGSKKRRQDCGADKFEHDGSPSNDRVVRASIEPRCADENPSLLELHPLEADVTASPAMNQAVCSYLVEPEEDYCFEVVQGRRIIDLAYFFSKLKSISNHNALFNCGPQCLSLVGEKRVGLTSKYKMKCDMCGSFFYIDSEDPAHVDNVDANVGAVIGIVSSGIAYSQFEEITSSLNLPIFSESLFSKIQNKLFDEWEVTAAEEMEAAAERERLAAIAEGKVKNGIAAIDVYADGCWSTRSYGNNYRALSGAAAIIGRKFGKVLYMAVKNKYCLICARAQKKGVAPKEHVCYKNYNGSSTGMEADIICEGFKSSIDMYNIIYSRLIADGDSATYAKILAANPYPNVTVSKIECRNHILRNLCNKLRAMTKETKYPLAYRKLLTNQKVTTIRKVLVSSAKKNSNLLADGLTTPAQAVQTLHSDVKNSILHVFGDHRNCKDYYCNKEKILTSAMELQQSNFWFRLKVIIGNVASKCRSLLEDVDTNTVERFNSVIAKMVGGKRICFTARRSYQARCAAAVVSFNNKHPKYTLQKRCLGKSPRNKLKKMEERRNLKREWNKRNPYTKNRTHNNLISQNDYGVNSKKPDMTTEEFEKAKDDFMKDLKILTSDRNRIQKETVLQRDCDDWLELRKNMVTASNFGQIIKRKKGTNCSSLVKNLLYKKNLSQIASIAHGVDNEKLALEQLAKQEGINIEPCGLFVDQKYSFIGATPDGVVDDDLIVEVKCPITAYKKGIDQAILENKIQIYKYDKKKNAISFNKNSNWFYQVQGQLHVTERKKCLFAIWSGENQPLKIEYIEKDDKFWEEKMEQKLVTFYMESLLPEIIDPRHSRGMPIRDSYLSEVSGVLNADNNKENAPDNVNEVVVRQIDFSQF